MTHESIALKALHAMPALLLRKPSKYLKLEENNKKLQLYKTHKTLKARLTFPRISCPPPILFIRLVS